MHGQAEEDRLCTTCYFWGEGSCVRLQIPGRGSSLEGCLCSRHTAYGAESEIAAAAAASDLGMRPAQYFTEIALCTAGLNRAALKLSVMCHELCRLLRCFHVAVPLLHTASCVNLCTEMMCKATSHKHLDGIFLWTALVVRPHSQAVRACTCSREVVTWHAGENTQHDVACIACCQHAATGEHKRV